MANPRKEDDKQNQGNQGAQKRADQAGQAVGETAGNMASSAVATADRTAETVGGGMRSAANTVRENTPREGMLGAASQAVASGLDKAGEYLEKEGVSGAANDVYKLVQSYPITALFVGVALGYLIGCATSSRS